MYEYAHSYHGFQRYSNTWDFQWPEPAKPKKPRKQPKRDASERFAKPTAEPPKPQFLNNYFVQGNAAAEMPLPTFSSTDFFTFR